MMTFESAGEAAAVTVQVAFGLIFLISAAEKALNASRFATAVRAYRLVPEFAAPAAAALIALAEATAGVALVARIESAFAAALGAALLSAFALAMSINLIRGRTDLKCGCTTGSSGQYLEWPLVARNGLMAIALLATAPAGSSIELSLTLSVVLPAALGLCLTYHALSGASASRSHQRRALRRF